MTVNPCICCMHIYMYTHALTYTQTCARVRARTHTPHAHTHTACAHTPHHVMQEGLNAVRSELVRAGEIVQGGAGGGEIVTGLSFAGEGPIAGSGPDCTTLPATAPWFAPHFPPTSRGSLQGIRPGDHPGEPPPGHALGDPPREEP